MTEFTSILLILLSIYIIPLVIDWIYRKYAIKVLYVHGEKTKLVYDSLGEHYLYPDGTTRIVKKRTWNKWVEETQISNIESATDGGDSVYFENWKTFINGKQNIEAGA